MIQTDMQCFLKEGVPYIPMSKGRGFTARSGKALYGADLSAAIRADTKAAGLKGVTVKCQSYSGGQSITATIRTSPADYIDEADYIAAYRVCANWIDDGERSVYSGDFYNMSAEEQERLRVAAALERVQRVKTIIEAYRYDESNAIKTVPPPVTAHTG